MNHPLTATLLAAVLTLQIGAAAKAGEHLTVTIAPRFQSDPLAFDALAYRTAAGQVVSVTRLDFLLSNIALRRADGGWLGLTNWFACLSPREGRTSLELSNIPAARYDRVRFFVGLPAEVNHRDPANYPAGHPLNPTVNGLHWNWQGGYVFCALEGNWGSAAPGEARATNPETGSPNSKASLNSEPLRVADPRAETEFTGYSFHVATDRQLMTVELPLALELFSDRELRLVLDVSRIFGQPNPIALTEATTSTHSRETDALVGQLRENIEHAFAVESIVAAAPMRAVRGVDSVEIAPGARPYALTVSRYFPRPALPSDNPLTEEGVALGRLLFSDTRLSVNNSQSCASCHKSAAAFTDGNAVSIGAEGQAGSRNAMPLFNLAWKSSFFWDGRAASLREQVLQPIQNPLEMHETLTNIVAKLQSLYGRQAHEPQFSISEIQKAKSEIEQALVLPASIELDYPSLFARAFGTSVITADRIARALEQFLLTQVSHEAKFDHALRGDAELTEVEKRGLQLFNTEYDPRRGQFGADCFHCHGGPLFQSQSFANNGLDAEPRDFGRFLVTGRPGDRGKFAVPSLRNVARTAPYMHDGRFGTLEEVIEHYRIGVKRSPTLDPNLAKHPAGGVPLSDEEKKALVAFLRTLTDERFPSRSSVKILATAP